MKFIKLPKHKTKRLTWEKLAKINNVSIKECKKLYYKEYKTFNFDIRPFAEGCKCPYRLKDLENDVCWLMDTKYKCKHFIRYEHDEQNNSYIVCNCKEKYIEGNLF